MKVCKKCKKEKDLTNYYVGTQTGKNGQIWKYYDASCIPCRKEYGSERRRNIKIQIIEYLGGKCADCELVDDPIVYDCHHTDDKSKDFSPGKVNRSFKSIKSELDKCVLLCCICHRKRHKVSCR